LTDTSSRWRIAPVYDRRRETVAYSITCADAGTDCPASFTTETKDELMKHVEMHANEAHPDLDLQPEQIEPLVKSTG